MYRNILYCGLKYDYGRKEQGPSYEFNNIEAGFLDCQERGFFKITCFHPDEDTPEQFLNYVKNGYFTDIFHVSFNESIDLDKNVLKYAISRGTNVIEWDCDSSWRFHNFIKGRKEFYTHFITTHSTTIPWYQAEGMKVIRSQWGGSPLYKKQEGVTKQYDVSFVGQRHGIRGEILQAFYTAGIQPYLFGNYWDGFPNSHGYISFDKMLDVFRQSKICLNLSNPWHIGTMDQIKGRHFELSQCGAFQLSTPADDLERYFEFDKEIVVAHNMQELINKTKYYLQHDDEREQIANAGYARMLKEHQWHTRLQNIFEEIV